MSADDRLEMALREADLADEVFLAPGYAAWEVVIDWHRIEIAALKGGLAKKTMQMVRRQRDRANKAEAGLRVMAGAVWSARLRARKAEAGLRVLADATRVEAQALLINPANLRPDLSGTMQRNFHPESGQWCEGCGSYIYDDEFPPQTCSDEDGSTFCADCCESMRQEAEKEEAEGA